MSEASVYRKFGIAWICLCLATAIHVTDEALTGFLSIYNPTVTILRQRWGWFPMPAFGYREWLLGLMGGIVIALLFSPFVFRGAAFMRPIAWILSVIMILNAGGHTLATILGRTVGSVRFARPAPGFYSSPLLLIAAIYLIIQLRRTASVIHPEDHLAVSSQSAL